MPGIPLPQPHNPTRTRGLAPSSAPPRVLPKQGRGRLCPLPKDGRGGYVSRRVRRGGGRAWLPTSLDCRMVRRGIHTVPTMVSQMSPLFHTSTVRPRSSRLISLGRGGEASGRPPPQQPPEAPPQFLPAAPGPS